MTSYTTLTGRLAAEALALWRTGPHEPVLEKPQLCLADAFSGVQQAAEVSACLP